MQDNIEILSPKTNVENVCNTKSVNCKNNIVDNYQSENLAKVECSNIKPKKPYLKRGTGLARYGLNLEEIKKATGKLKFHKPKLSIPPKINVTRKCLNQVVKFSNTECGK